MQYSEKAPASDRFAHRRTQSAGSEPDHSSRRIPRCATWELWSDARSFGGRGRRAEDEESFDSRDAPMMRVSTREREMDAARDDA